MGDGNGTRYVTWREFEDWRDDLRHQMRDLGRGQADINRKLDDFILNFHKREAEQLREVIREVEDDREEDRDRSWAKRMAIPGWAIGIAGFFLAVGAFVAELLSRT